MTKDKCNNCGANQIKAPISKIPFWEGDPLKSNFRWDAFKPENIIWKNIFKMDLLALAFIGIVLFMTWSYSHDIGEYKQIYEEPCEFVKANSEVCFQKELQEEIPDIFFPVTIDPIS